jgi:hypothetical protein
MEDLGLAGKIILKEPYRAGRVLYSTGSVVERLHNNPKTGAIRTFNNISRNNYMYPYCNLNINMSHLKVIISAG